MLVFIYEGKWKRIFKGCKQLLEIIGKNKKCLWPKLTNASFGNGVLLLRGSELSIPLAAPGELCAPMAHTVVMLTVIFVPLVQLQRSWQRADLTGGRMGRWGLGAELKPGPKATLLPVSHVFVRQEPAWMVMQGRFD